jgi:DNA-binding MarR family transcriptional regulator
MSLLPSQGQAPPIDTISLYRVMDFLLRKGSPKMSELGQAVSVSLPTATRIAKILVDNGYAERLSDPRDGRLVRLALTDYGKSTHDVIERFLLQSIRKNLDYLTPEEQTILFILVDKVRATLRRNATDQKSRHREVMG